MNNKKTTKRALLSSVLSLVLCMAMLIGTTFAWFTDNATSGVNTIQSGKLDIVLEMKDADGKWVDAQGKTLDFIKADNSDTILWEPGCTYQLPAIRVRNNGNLALKYELVINGVNGDAKLLEVIEWTANGSALTNYSGQLEKQGDTSEQIVVQGHMKEDANNDYQGLTVSGISISVFATQLAYEYDSFDNQYDANAPEGTTFVEANGKKYDTIAAAMADDAKAIYIAGEQEFTAAQAGSNTDMEGVSITGVTEDATIAVNGTGGGISNVNLKNLMVVDETVYVYENGENAWEFTYLEIDGDNTFDGVAFDDGILVEGGNSTFSNCSFSGHNNDSSDRGNTTMYGAWVYSGTASFTNCKFFGTRGLKVADQYSGSDVTEVVVDSCFFGPLSEKPGLAVDNRLGSLNLIIKNSTFAGTQPGDAAEDNTKGVPYIYENDNRTPDVTTITLDNNAVIKDVKFVASADELKALSATTLTGNNGKAEEATIVLTSDIDMKGADFSAIIAQRGDSLTVIGNGHTISNINVVSGTNDNTTGQASVFYAYPNSTLTISDLILQDVVATSDSNDSGYAAAVIGYCEGTAILNNVDVVNAKIVGAKSSGALVGHLSGALTATNCDVSGTVTLTDYEEGGHYAGKYIGTLAGTATLKQCTADVTLGGNLKAANVGDIFGRNLGTLNQ